MIPSWNELLDNSLWSPSLARRYGRKRGYLRHCVAFSLYSLGAYDRFVQMDWRRVRRLVFVCKGNICRSPYAEARARRLGLPSDSFGLTAGLGKPANPVASAISGRRGVDLSRHVTKQRDGIVVVDSDLLIGMEPRQAKELLEISTVGPQVTLAGLWADPPRPHIEDPFGQSEAYFETCFDILDTAIEVICRNVRSARSS